MSQFSKKEAIKFGWQKMQQNFKFLLLVMILMMVVQGVQSGIGQLTQGDEGAMVVATGLIGVVFWVINIVLALGIIKIALQIVDGNKPTFDDLLNNWDVIVKYFLTSLVYGLIGVAAFIAGLLPVAAVTYGIAYAALGSISMMSTIITIIAGFLAGLAVAIYFGIKYQFAQYFTVSEKQGPMTAIKSSATVTKGEIGSLFLFGLLVVLINIAGALIFLIGLFATIPTTMIATAYVFRKLQGKGVPNPVPLPETKPAL